MNDEYEDGDNEQVSLDFVFVNTAARPLALTSVILQEAGDCDNAAANPEHRPLRAEFEFGAVAPAPTRAELLERIEALERQMLELKTLISEGALIGMADSTACPTDRETIRQITRPVTLRRPSRPAGSGCVGIGRLRG